MEDASLDEFLDSRDRETDEDEDEDEAAATDDDAGSADGEREATEAEAVESATAIYEWSPGGVECTSCGGTADRRWHSETGRVCAECKEW